MPCPKPQRKEQGRTPARATCLRTELLAEGTAFQGQSSKAPQSCTALCGVGWGPLLHLDRGAPGPVPTAILSVPAEPAVCACPREALPAHSCSGEKPCKSCNNSSKLVLKAGPDAGCREEGRLALGSTTGAKAGSLSRPCQAVILPPPPHPS